MRLTIPIRTGFAFCLLAAGSTCRPVAAKPDAAAIKKQVRADVQAMTRAMVAGDFAKVADLTHPLIVRQMGGREKMIAATGAELKQMVADGFKFLPSAVDEATDPVVGGTDLYVVVPYTMVMSVPGGTLCQRTFVIGQSSDGGTTWTYVNGDVDEALVRRVLPTMPNALRLPDRVKPVITQG